MFQPVEFDCNLSPTVFWKILPMLHFCVCQKMKDTLLMKIRERPTNKQTDSRQMQHQESVKPHTPCRWLVGGWDLEDGGLQTPQSAPILFTRRLFWVLPLSLHCHPPTYWRRAGGTRHTNSNNLATGNRQEASCILVHFNLSNCIYFLKCIVTQSW